MKNKIILILRGGLGNQLFTYAAAIQLAKNNADIFVDTKLGFYADNFNRKYELDNLQKPPKSLSYNEKFTGLIFFHIR